VYSLNIFEFYRIPGFSFLIWLVGRGEEGGGGAGSEMWIRIGMLVTTPSSAEFSCPDLATHQEWANRKRGKPAENSAEYSISKGSY
jgi:hypothetical protein